MAFSREIIKKILQSVQFRVPTTEEKSSYYTQIGETLVRISNHCTRLYVWDDILEKNPNWKGLPIVSIVFEDTEDTFNETECLVLKRFRMKPIKVKEYVYCLQGNPHFLTTQDERLIIQSIKEISGRQYSDATNKCRPQQIRTSINPTQDNKPQQINCNTNMKKKVIRLTESILHGIIKESVKNIVSEFSTTPTQKEERQQRFHDASEEPNIGDTIIVLTGVSNVGEPNVAFIGKYIGNHMVETVHGKESMNSWAKWMLRSDFINLAN